MKSKRFGADAKSRTNRAGGKAEAAMLLPGFIEGDAFAKRAGCCCSSGLDQ